jgi:hypothetical protein
MISKSALFVLFTASLALFSQASGEEGNSDVLELNSETFDAAIKEHPLLLAEFFAPWVRALLLLSKYSADIAELLNRNMNRLPRS